MSTCIRWNDIALIKVQNLSGYSPDSSSFQRTTNFYNQWKYIQCTKNLNWPPFHPRTHNYMFVLIVRIPIRSFVILTNSRWENENIKSIEEAMVNIIQMLTNTKRASKHTHLNMELNFGQRSNSPESIKTASKTMRYRQRINTQNSPPKWLNRCDVCNNIRRRRQKKKEWASKTCIIQCIHAISLSSSLSSLLKFLCLFLSNPPSPSPFIASFRWRNACICCLGSSWKCSKRGWWPPVTSSIKNSQFTIIFQWCINIGQTHRWRWATQFKDRVASVLQALLT